MKQLPNYVLVKLVVDYYSSDDIDSARDKLYKNFPDEFRPNNSRKKSFKGSENVLVQKNSKHIISVQSNPVNCIPDYRIIRFIA